MSSHLSAIPIPKRRQLAATLGLFAMLFVAVGAVALTVRSTVVQVFVGIAFLIAVVLALVAWGVITSVHRDLAERRLDAAIADVVAERGASVCSCGHDHDPNEMHVLDGAPIDTEACAHDGAGEACAHDCTSCVLAAARPRPAASRPSPRPRPRPTPTSR